MARIHSVTAAGDGQVVVLVDVAVDTLAPVVVPTWVWLEGGAQAVADAVARRYRDRTHRLRGDAP